jgi:hypothetical protein
MDCFVLEWVFSVRRQQLMPASIQDEWDFFSSPRNLPRITPSKMNLEILNPSVADKICTGQLTEYHVTVAPLIRIKRVTEITKVSEPVYFLTFENTAHTLTGCTDISSKKSTMVLK